MHDGQIVTLHRHIQFNEQHISANYAVWGSVSSSLGKFWNSAILPILNNVINKCSYVREPIFGSDPDPQSQCSTYKQCSQWDAKQWYKPAAFTLFTTAPCGTPVTKCEFSQNPFKIMVYFAVAKMKQKYLQHSIWLITKYLRTFI
jgi:hypothetical protein